ncbi:MAG: insulinase family protein [Rhodospirillaceae bacterium]|nr:insulinase family protein [Rhodospirillaceae bacterium]
MNENASVRVSTLPNGLRVSTDFMPGVDSVALGVWAAVGTRSEPEAVNGVAHMLEHMAFKGTARRSARAIAEEIEAVGGHLNAYTSRESTAYYARLLADDLALGVDILADILQNSVFAEEELERERAVVLQEIGQAEDTPDDIIFDRFQETAFPDQPMGRPVLGSVETVSRLSRDALIDYMRAHYTGERLILAAAGRVDHDRLVELAAEAFAATRRGEGAAGEPPVYRGGGFREERGLEQVHVVLGFPGIAFRDPDYYAASVLSTLLGGGMSSRLFQEIREKRGLVYSIYSFSSSYSDSGLFGIYAGTGEEEVESLIPLVCDELKKVADGPTPAEVDRARAQLRAGILMAQESTSARCEQLANQLLVWGRPLDRDEILARVEAVGPEDVVRVARRLIAARPTLAALGPVARVEDAERTAARLR